MKYADIKINYGIFTARSQTSHASSFRYSEPTFSAFQRFAIR